MNPDLAQKTADFIQAQDPFGDVFSEFELDQIRPQPAIDAAAEEIARSWSEIDRLQEDESSPADAAYSERNQLVALLARLFPSGVKSTAIEGWDPAWHGCVYIDLPTGQASWHYHEREAHLFAQLPPYQGEWDGHTTEEKYQRIAALSPTVTETAVAEVDEARFKALCDMFVGVQPQLLRWYIEVYLGIEPLWAQMEVEEARLEDAINKIAGDCVYDDSPVNFARSLVAAYLGGKP